MSDSEDRASRPTRHHLLIVDDEALGVALLERALSGRPDLEVSGTTSPLRALDIARHRTVDVVVADQRMPEMNGVELIGRLRALQPEVIPILLTAYPDLSLVIRAVNEAAIYKFLAKPCDPGEVEMTVVRAIELLDLRRENGRLAAELRERNQALESTIAELRSAQGELVRSEKMAAIGRLCSGVAHELAAPTTVLMHQQRVLDRLVGALTPLQDAVDALLPTAGNAEVRARAAALLDRARTESASRVVIEAGPMFERAVQSIRSLVQSLRSYSHPGGAAREPWDVREGMERTLRMLSHRLSGVAVMRDYGDVPPVVCSGQEMGQVLLNLIANAADALDDRGPRDARIGIRTRWDGEMVRIEVADTGTGMDDETVGRLFHPFFTTKPVGKGTGLGLSICRRIVDEHGGRMEVRSAVGRGTVVTVLLPHGGGASASAPAP